MTITVPELDAEEFLQHYGVLGMKWGKRKGGDDSNSNLTTLTSPPKNADAIRANKHREMAKRGGTDALSDAQLKKLVERMNMEANYARLTPEKVSFGAKLAQDMLPVVGKEVMNQIARRKPQVEPSVPDFALAKPSGKRMVGDILADTGKTILREHGLKIGIGIAGMILKSTLK